MNPLIHFIPTGANLGIRDSDTVNERSLNLIGFARVEESAIDLYGAVGDGYLQGRDAAISV